MGGCMGGGMGMGMGGMGGMGGCMGGGMGKGGMGMGGMGGMGKGMGCKGGMGKGDSWMQETRDRSFVDMGGTPANPMNAMWMRRWVRTPPESNSSHPKIDG